MSEKSKKFMYGIFSSEDTLIKAIKGMKKEGINLFEAYVPYPVHHLDEYLGHKRSRLSKAAFAFGATGFSLAIWMQVYMMGYAWPMIVGGKDHIAAPSFVPVTFESTVLIAALGMVGTFLVSNNLAPWNFKPEMFDPRSTDDKFVLALEIDRNKNFSETQITESFKKFGAEEVNHKEFFKN